jgi:hypothetical protein
MVRRSWPILWLMALAACGGPDRVEFRNAAPGLEIGALLDGRLNDTDVNDRVFTTSQARLEPGDLRPGRRDEVAAFQEGRAPALSTLRWKDGEDEAAVSFPSEIQVRVRFWMLQGPADERRAQVMAAEARLNELWRRERMGVTTVGVEVVDRTGDASLERFLDFTCSSARDLAAAVGRLDGALNFYYVGRVDFGSGFSTGNGVTCADDLIAMGRGASPHLAVHEAGHAFDLAHTNDVDGFDRTNVMHNASNTREFFTEGQLFRAHLEPGSFLNTASLRVGQPVRRCPFVGLEATDECPSLQRRIWADGTFPANSLAGAASPRHLTSPQARVSSLLVEDCGIPGEPSPAFRAVMELGDEAVDPLLQALEAGPPAAELAAIELPRRAAFALAYRERALNLLGVLGGPRGVAALQAITPSLPDELQPAAAETLRRLRAAHP